ncbi:MAG: Xaa-Pro peptidase family protein [Actinomycetia bacterium]|nr:Xaa-Pro peptidase family protein [Actinomycetes bacterium]
MDPFADGRRLAAAQEAARRAGIDALLVTPGPDLLYLTGYQAIALERLTCLVVPANGEPVLVAPELEVPAAQASPLGAVGVPIRSWAETDDPYALVAALVAALAPRAAAVALTDSMAAGAVLRLRDAMPKARQQLAGPVLRELRMIKSPDEIEYLRRAGRAIDSVHEQVPDFLRPGRTEREVGDDIAEAILAAGHTTVDFVIVASGPNGASPHHEVSDRRINVGDPVVVDIGGTMDSGYCSDSTRTYALGHAPDDFLAYYTVLQEAQRHAVESVRPGVTAESVDTVARDAITEAGYGDRFIHRTGHGIGLETHEEPYIVQGNAELLRAGMAFSVEPGIYLPNQHGARIEDIVVVSANGVESLNNTTHELVVIDPTYSS